MSKANNKKQSEEQVITLDIQPFLTPAAIILSSIIISISLLVSVNGIAVNTSSDSLGVSDTADTAPIANNDGQPAGNPSATTTIDDDPILGDKDKAKVAIVEFSDYECPFCKRHHEQTFDQIVSNYVDTGKAIMVYRDFPLSFHDPLATDQAMAAECVQDLAGDNKYFEYSKLIFETTQSNGQGMSRSQLFDLANDIGVDGNKVESCVDSDKFREEVQKDIADGVQAGVTGTPGFVIGILNEDGSVDGVNVSGAQPYSVFEQVIEEQLERAN
jgi:protein-disulfide isomerase